jgi:hypothetical protein
MHNYIDAQFDANHIVNIKAQICIQVLHISYSQDLASLIIDIRNSSRHENTSHSGPDFYHSKYIK